MGESAGDLGPFVAIDFETADYGRDSACAVGMARVEGGRIVRREKRFVRPPRRWFVFDYIHGITWDRVAREPSFRTLWPELRAVLEGARFIAAHQASFDRSVLEACCAAARVAVPRTPFECTVKLARRIWGIRPTTLPFVCGVLGIRLRHHDPLSDAEACARIVLAAHREGGLVTEGGRDHGGNIARSSGQGCRVPSR